MLKLQTELLLQMPCLEGLLLLLEQVGLEVRRLADLEVATKACLRIQLEGAGLGYAGRVVAIGHGKVR